MDINILKNIIQPIFYVTNDVSRGIGLEKVLPNYHIICLDDHPVVDFLIKAGVSVFCLERALGQKNALFRSSGIVLDHPLVLNFIKEKSNGQTPQILFFKPQRKIELLAQKYNFKLIGNPVAINRLFEDKIVFFELCLQEKICQPKGAISYLPALNYQELVKKFGEVFVCQFGRGWAGNSTFFIKTEDELKALQNQFGSIRVKVSEFIEGRTVLNNGVVLSDQVLLSQPALQIRAHGLLTATSAGTGGRQWPTSLELDQEEKIKNVSKKIGMLMGRKGYRGYFGLDFLIREKDGEVFLSEDNARLTASASFYTKLELLADSFPLLGYHVLAFLALNYLNNLPDYEAPEILGSEIVCRNTCSGSIKIEGSVATGMYGEDWGFKKETYFMEDGGQGDFWLQTVAQGRLVNPEIEILKLQTQELVADESGGLKSKYLDLIEKIRKQLKIADA